MGMERYWFVQGRERTCFSWHHPTIFIDDELGFVLRSFPNADFCALHGEGIHTGLRSTQVYVL